MLKDTNYITHLNGALERFAADNRLNPTHISLYMALFQCWNRTYFSASFRIYRDEIMTLSKIGSKTTYYRCLKDLSRWKYIHYSPSHNLFKGCSIKMTIYWTDTGLAVDHSGPTNGTGDGLAVDSSGTTFGTGAGPAVVPLIKHIQTIENIKTNKKQKFLKNSFFKKSKSQNSSALNPDHLHAVEKKNI